MLNFSKVLIPIGNEYYFSVTPASIPAFTIPASRKLPVDLPYPIAMKIPLSISYRPDMN